MGKPPATDVLVIGAGIWGLACAFACLRRGLSVIVAEAEIPGAGASGGPVGALSPHLPDPWTAQKAFQRDALLAAGSWWGEVQAAGGIDPGYSRPGRLMPIASRAARARAEARAAGAFRNWAGEARWEVLGPGSRADWLDASAAPFGVIFETLSARIEPRAAIAALVAAVVRMGGEIRTGWRAISVLERGADFEQGRIAAGATIVAAGCGGPALTALPGRGVKGQAAVVAAEVPADAPLIFVDGLYIVPHPGGRVAVGSTSEQGWSDATAIDGQLEALLERARSICPRLAGAAVIERWAGIRPRAARPEPMLGPVPGRSGVYVAAGAFKTGFGLAPSVGEVLADFVEGRTPELPEGFGAGDHLAAGLRR